MGWLLPGVGVQVALHRQAGTDLPAQLAYQDDITDLHTRLRDFFYRYLFEEIPFTQADFAKLPQFTFVRRHVYAPLPSLFALSVMAGLMVLVAARTRPDIRM